MRAILAALVLVTLVPVAAATTCIAGQACYNEGSSGPATCDGPGTHTGYTQAYGSVFVVYGIRQCRPGHHAEAIGVGAVAQAGWQGTQSDDNAYDHSRFVVGAPFIVVDWEHRGSAYYDPGCRTIVRLVSIQRDVGCPAGAPPGAHTPIAWGQLLP